MIKCPFLDPNPDLQFQNQNPRGGGIALPPGILPLPQAPHPRLHPTLPTPQTALRGNFSTTQCSEEDSTQFMLPRILSPCSALPGILVPHALASGKHSLPDNGILPSSHCCPGAHLRTAQCSPGRAASLTLYQIHLLLRPPLGRTRCSTHGSTGEYLLLRLRPTGGRCSLNTLLYWDSFYPTHRSPRAPTPHVALQGIFLIGQCNIWDTNLARGHFLPDITSPGTAPYHIHHSSGETSTSHSSAQEISSSLHCSVLNTSYCTPHPLGLLPPLHAALLRQRNFLSFHFQKWFRIHLLLITPPL